MTTEKPLPNDLHALAAEVMDLWQGHLSACAEDPSAKAELMRAMEPQRRLFADWAAMMQNGTPPAKTGFDDKHEQSTDDKKAGVAEASGAASDNGSLRVAQLAYRVAELEKRLERLEAGTAGTAARTARRGKPTKP